MVVGRLAGYMADNDLVTGTGSEKLSKRAYTYAIGFVDRAIQPRFRMYLSQ